MAHDRQSGEPLSEDDASLLSGYLDGQLSDSERTALEARLQADAALQAELEALRQMVAAMRALPSLRPPRNFTLDAATYGRLPAPRRLARAAPLMASGAAMFIVAACVGALLLGGPGVRNAAAPQAGAVFSGEAGDLAEAEAPAEEAPAVIEEELAEQAIEAPVEEQESPAEEEAAAPAAEPAPAGADVAAGDAGEAAEPQGEPQEIAEEEAEEEPAGDEGAAAEAEDRLLEAEATLAYADGVVQSDTDQTEPLGQTELATPTESLELAERSSAEDGEGAGGPAPPAPTPEPPTPLQEPTPVTLARPFVVGVALGIVAVFGVGLFMSGLSVALASRRR